MKRYLYGLALISVMLLAAACGKQEEAPAGMEPMVEEQGDTALALKEAAEEEAQEVMETAEETGEELMTEAEKLAEEAKVKAEEMMEEAEEEVEGLVPEGS